jgi:hypothetical protein
MVKASIGFLLGELEWQLFHAFQLRRLLRWDSVVEVSALGGLGTLYVHGLWRKQLLASVVRKMRAQGSSLVSNPGHSPGQRVLNAADTDLLVKTPITVADSAMPTKLFGVSAVSYSLPPDLLSELKDRSEELGIFYDSDTKGTA